MCFLWYQSVCLSPCLENWQSVCQRNISKCTWKGRCFVVLFDRNDDWLVLYCWRLLTRPYILLSSSSSFESVAWWRCLRYIYETCGWVLGRWEGRITTHVKVFFFFLKMSKNYNILGHIFNSIVVIDPKNL